MSGSTQAGSTPRGDSTRTTAQPLAHALDATLSHLMDQKISNFGRAFKQMEGRLNKQQAVLGRLEEKIREEREYSDKVDVQIQEAVQRIHTLLDQKVTAEELETLRCKMDQMEAYIKREIEEKMEEINTMHGVLENFTTLGQKVEQAQSEAHKRAAETKQKHVSMVDDMKKMQEEQFKQRSATHDPSPRIAAQALKSVQGMRSNTDESNMSVPTMGPPNDFKEFLRNINLAEYFDRFAELGFREMHSLQELGSAKLEDLCRNDVDMRGTEVQKLLQALNIA